MPAKKTAVIGGTFNPVHNGHIFLAQLLINETEYSRLIFIPVNKPSHKIEEVVMSAEHRVNMLQMSIQDISSNEKEIILDDCEISRGGLSYSLDTVNYIYNTYEVDGKLGFIIGDDLAATLSTWYKWDILKEKVTFLIAKRETFSDKNIMLPPDLDYRIMNNAIKEISSSSVRMKIMKGEDVSGFLPVSVYEYIKEHRLYIS